MQDNNKRSATTKNIIDTDLDHKMLCLLVCPLTKQGLKYKAETGELISVSARLAYPVRGGVPIMLPSEARTLADRELKTYD